MDGKDIFTPNLTTLLRNYQRSLSALMFLSYPLKTGNCTFKPNEIAHFKDWLDRFKVRDIEVDKGIPYVTRTPNLSKAPNGFFNLIKLSKKENEQRTNNKGRDDR